MKAVEPECLDCHHEMGIHIMGGAGHCVAGIEVVEGYDERGESIRKFPRLFNACRCRKYRGGP